MSDYISREEALKKICGKKCGCYFDECGYTEPCTYGKIIADFPSANVRENIHGEWIRITHGIEVFHKCSVCGEEGDYVLPKRNFCPNCGADMRGDNNG